MNEKMLTIVSVGSAMTHPFFRSSVALKMALGFEMVVIFDFVWFIEVFLFNNLLSADLKDFIDNLVPPSVPARLIAAFEESSHRLIRRACLNLHEVCSVVIA